MSSTISVIIPVYNGENTIIRCLESIPKSNKIKEILIVDDGSVDSSIEKVNEWKLKQCNTKNIQIIKQTNKGVSSARNAGLSKASGNWVIFLDCDDEISIELIENFCIYRKAHEQTRAFFFNGLKNDVNGEKEGDFILSRFPDINEYSRFSKFDNYLLSKVVIGSPFPMCAAVINRKSALDVGGFSTEYRYGEDRLFWIKIIINNDTIVSSKKCVQVNYNGNNVTGNRNKLVLLKSTLKLNDDIMRIGLDEFLNRLIRVKNETIIKEIKYYFYKKGPCALVKNKEDYGYSVSIFDGVKSSFFYIKNSLRFF